ncbi:hypothetical protein CVT26_004929 [Gymnopilus dilepis]|uniref:Uncharacterized protein n=1 Tax=Gymnopilus dilepis TaxID=231916 RepID=A0A409YJ36_9AGAR|nr:hypothetical protein CVT26_004929 [Gymnopilus dilepis]
MSLGPRHRMFGGFVLSTKDSLKSVDIESSEPEDWGKVIGELGEVSLTSLVEGGMNGQQAHGCLEIFYRPKVAGTEYCQCSLSSMTGSQARMYNSRCLQWRRDDSNSLQFKRGGYIASRTQSSLSPRENPAGYQFPDFLQVLFACQDGLEMANTERHTASPRQIESMNVNWIDMLELQETRKIIENKQC